MNAVNLASKKKKAEPANTKNPTAAIFNMVPSSIRQYLRQLGPEILGGLEELRLRQDRPVILSFNNRDFFINKNGGLTENPEQAYCAGEEDIQRTVQLVSGSSLYALEEELRNGYITLPGGHRVGITGKVLAEQGQVRSIKYISGFNFRVCRQVLGAADKLIKHLISFQREVHHTMIISPPRCGKTTLLRDIVRQLSNGIPHLNFPGVTVAVVDERSEIAGCYRGVPQQDVGVRTDVLDSCPKAAGMIMLLRSMSPQVIATDEIGRLEDVNALEEVFNAGVKVLTTVHGASLEEISRRPALRELLQLKVIERFVILDRSKGPGTIKHILDGKTCRSLGVV